MSENGVYHDRRDEFFREYFKLGLAYDDYLSTGAEKHRQKWTRYYDSIKLNNLQISILRTFSRRMNVVVLSGIWCGDCARQGPMFRLIEENCSGINFRYLDNREHRELQEELRMNGAEKVPVIVVLTEDFYEISRFGDRHLSVYRSKAAKELGAACDPGLLPPPEAELQVELGEWIEYFERLNLMLRLAPALRKRYND